MARDYDKVISWISKNYSAGDFGIDEDELKEKITTETRYDFNDEINQIKQKLHDDNSPNFSYRLLNKLSREKVYDKLIASDLNRIKMEATKEKEIQARAVREEEMRIARQIAEEEEAKRRRAIQRAQTESARRRRQELEEQGINPDF